MMTSKAILLAIKKADDDVLRSGQMMPGDGR